MEEVGRKGSIQEAVGRKRSRWNALAERAKDGEQALGVLSLQKRDWREVTKGSGLEISLFGVMLSLEKL